MSPGIKLMSAYCRLNASFVQPISSASTLCAHSIRGQFPFTTKYQYDSSSLVNIHYPDFHFHFHLTPHLPQRSVSLHDDIPRQQQRMVPKSSSLVNIHGNNNHYRSSSYDGSSPSSRSSIKVSYLSGTLLINPSSYG